jgi:hypothetical protein
MLSLDSEYLEKISNFAGTRAASLRQREGVEKTVNN